MTFATKTLSALAGSVMLFGAGNAHAVLINMDYGKGDMGFGTGDSVVYTGAAAIGSAGDFWNATDTEANDFSETLDLLDSTGASTGVTLVWTDEAQSSVNAGAIEFGSSGHNGLMEDYAFTGPNDTATFTMTGLATNLDYTLYLYGVPDNNGQETTFAVVGANEGAQAVTAGNIADDNGLANPDDYVVFTGNTGALGQIVYTQTGGGNFSGSNGFQLDVVPEPGSLALLGLGSLAVLRRRRPVKH